MSPSATIAAQPELLSPEAANRPLPQDDVGQHSHQHAQPPPASRHNHASSPYDAPPRSGTPYSTWPVGFVPYPPGYSTSSSSGKHGTAPERDHRHAYSPAPELLLSDRTPTPLPGSSSGSDGGVGRAGSQSGGYVRGRAQSASTSMGRYAASGAPYEAAPLPPGLTYPPSPARPSTSHRRQRDPDRDRDRDRDREWDRDRARERHRDVRDWDGERERERVRDRDRDRERRRNPGRDYERNREGETGRDRRREQDSEDTDQEARSPAPLQRPISLFDSDE